MADFFEDYDKKQKKEPTSSGGSGNFFEKYDKAEEETNKRVATTRANMSEKKISNQLPTTSTNPATKPMPKNNNFTHPADTDAPIVKDQKPTQPMAINNNAKLGLSASPQKNPYNQPLPSKELLRSNPSIKAPTNTPKGNPITAGLKQIQHGMQSAVAFQQQPTSEVSSTGNKTIDSLLRETGGFLPGLASGQTEAEILGVTNKAVQYVGGKILPKMPILNKITGHAVEAGVENARVGAAAGQTDTRQVADNFKYGAALGGLGSGLKETAGAAGRYVRNTAKEITEDIISRGGKDEVGKRQLSRVDEQIQALYKSNAPDKNEQLKGLFYERNQVIDYIKQNEPEFDAPEPRVTADKNDAALTEPPTPIVAPKNVVEHPEIVAPPPPVETPQPSKAVANEVADEVESSKKQLAVLDDQIEALIKGDEPDKQVKFEALVEDRKEVVNFIYLHEPKPSATAPEAGRGIRSNYANQLENGNFSPELQQGIRNTDQSYEIARNADTAAKANENVKNLTKAEASFMGNESGGAEHIATGYRLMQELDALGEHERALNVANKLAADLTKSGQTSQAASILGRLSPEGQFLNLVRTAERNGKTLTPEDAAHFKQEAGIKQDQQGAGVRENKYLEILDHLEAGKPVSPEDMQFIETYLARANKAINPPAPKKSAPAKAVKSPKEAKPKDVKPKAAVATKVKDMNLDEAFPEFKAAPKKREKMISFLEDQEQKALARIKARRNNLNALPVNEWADHAIVVSSQIAKGSIKAATHVEDLVKMFGEEIKPHATMVYLQAQKIVKGVARKSAEDRLDAAKQVFKKATGREEADAAVVEEMAHHVKQVIDSAKKGKVDASDLQKMRDYADEIAEMLGDKPGPKVPNKDEKYLQTVKTLSKKLANVEKKKTPASPLEQQEIEGLIRQISNLKEGANPPKAKKAVDVTALSNVAHDLLKKPRPLPKLRKTPTKEVAAANKALVQKLANNVKSVIEQSKKGEIDAKTLQMIRDNSAAVAKTAGIPKVQTAEQKFLQSVKSLAKKVARVETAKVPTTQLNREVEGVLRNVIKLQNAEKPKVVQQKVNSSAVSNIAHDLLNKTRPTPKPTTLQEKIVDKYIKKNPQVTPADISKLRALAKDVTALEGKKGLEADMAMQKILNSYEKSSPWDMVQAVRYLMMLGNEGTQLLNAVSGPIMATTGTAADVIPAMVDLAMHKVFKTKRNVTLYGTNPLRFMADWFKNAKMGGRAGWEGVNPDGIQSASEIRGLAFKSKKNPLGLAERSLGAVSKGADYGTYKTVFDAELKREGHKAAVNSGVKGKKDIEEFIQKFVNKPPAEAVEIADRIGKNTTFQRTDSLGAQIANLPNMATGKSKHVVKPLTSAIMPFVRTPLNIASTAVNMTPVGVLKGLFQLTKRSDASNREALRTLGMSLVGSAGLSSLGYYLSSIGIITGANDSGDTNVNAVKEQAGRGKYRFNTSALNRYLWAMLNGEGTAAAEKAAKFQEDDNRFDYNKVQPLAFPLAIGAGLQEGKDKGLGGQVYHAGTDAIGSLLGMSSVKTLQDVVQPGYSGTGGEKQMGIVTKVVEAFAKSFSPSILAQDTRRQDQTVRKTSFNDGFMKDVKEYYQSRLPKNMLGIPNGFNSSKLPPSKTTLGMDKLNPPGISGQYLNPFRSEKAPYNEAAVIISDLIDRTGETSIAPKPPEKTVGGKTIPDKRYAQLQEELGNDIIKQILSLDSSKSDAEKVAAIEKMYRVTRKKHMDIVKKELGVPVT